MKKTAPKTSTANRGLSLEQWFEAVMSIASPGRYSAERLIRKVFDDKPNALDRKRLNACHGRSSDGKRLARESCSPRSLWNVVNLLALQPESRVTFAGYERELMPSFERAFEAISGFRFATQQSLQNALLALYWAARRQGGEKLKVPMIVITGPSGSGKSRLASILSDRAAPCLVADKSEVGVFLSTASVSALGQRGCCVFEDVGKTLLESVALKTYLTASHWSYRPYLSRESIQVPALAMIIVTGNTIQLPADLARRSVVIELIDRELPW